jgi:pre-mRNA-splicing factor 38B
VIIVIFILQIGFLYLRYAADPKTLWTWYEPYIEDDEVLFLFCYLSASVAFV